MKYFYYILIFIIIGESICRIDVFLNSKQIQDISISKNLKIESADKKIFLLGDSYTKGLGIREEERIANILHIQNYRVIDSSRSGDNWADYLFIIKNIRDSLNPKDYIIIGVNWNDVSYIKGSLFKIIANQINLQKKDVTKDEKEITKISTKNMPISGIRFYFHWLYENSALANFLSGNIQNLLKRKGIPLPIGDFAYFKDVAYEEKKVELFEALKFIDTCNRNSGTKTILYLMPDFNLTGRSEYFEEFRKVFKNQEFKNIIILDGIDDFSNTKDGYYCISVHDGHPNNLAHKKITKQVAEVIKKDLSVK